MPHCADDETIVYRRAIAAPLRDGPDTIDSHQLATGRTTNVEHGARRSSARHANPDRLVYLSVRSDPCSINRSKFEASWMMMGGCPHTARPVTRSDGPSRSRTMGSRSRRAWFTAASFQNCADRGPIGSPRCDLGMRQRTVRSDVSLNGKVRNHRCSAITSSVCWMIAKIRLGVLCGFLTTKVEQCAFEHI